MYFIYYYSRVGKAPRLQILFYVQVVCVCGAALHFKLVLVLGAYTTGAGLVCVTDVLCI